MNKNNTKHILVKLFFYLCVGGAIGVSGFTYYYAKGFSYFSNDPNACANCHIMKDQHESWQKSSHHQVTTCNSCHAPESIYLKYFNKAENGFWHSLKFTTGDFKDPIRIRPHNKKIVINNCLKCHSDLLSMPSHENQNREGDSCLQCHREIGHSH